MPPLRTMDINAHDHSLWLAISDPLLPQAARLKRHLCSAEALKMSHSPQLTRTQMGELWAKYKKGEIQLSPESVLWLEVYLGGQGMMEVIIHDPWYVRYQFSALVPL